MYLLKEIQDYKRRILPDLILKIYSSAEFIIYSRYVGFLTEVYSKYNATINISK